MKHLKDYLKFYKVQSMLAPLFKMLEACFDLTVPLIVADIINTGIANSDTAYIIKRFFLLLLVLAIIYANGYAKRMHTTVVVSAIISE